MDKIYLDKNENRYPHSQKVLDYLKQISPSIISSYSSSIDPLVDEIGKIYKVPTEQIFLTHGGEALLKEAIGSILQASDTVLLPEGSWAYYTELIKAADAKPHFFNLEKEESKYSYSAIKIIESLKFLQPKLLIIASPNNPTGHIISQQDLTTILDMAKQTQTFVILDEAYFGYAYPLYTWEDIKGYPKLLVVRTLSKFFGLAGLRIGFGFHTDGWEKLSKELYRYLGFSHLSSEIALYALHSLEHYEKNAQILIQEREKLENYFISLDWTVFKSSANFIFVELPEGIFSRAVEFFYTAEIQIKFFNAVKEPWFKNCIRITVGLPSDNLQVCHYFTKMIKG